MIENTFYARSLDDSASVEQWQKLEDHLRNVAEIAARFAAAFGSEEWGFLAGLWHDIGKYRAEFQRKLLVLTRQQPEEYRPLCRCHTATHGNICCRFIVLSKPAQDGIIAKLQ